MSATYENRAIKYRHYLGLEGLNSIHADWLDLLARIGDRQRLPHNPFWYQCYLKCLPTPAVCFTTAWAGDQLVAVLPLIRCTRTRWRVRFSSLELPNNPFNYLRDAVVDPLAAPHLSLRALCRVAGKAGITGDRLVLDHFAEGSLLGTINDVRTRQPEWTHLADSLFVRINPTYKPAKEISAHFRGALNNKRNRLLKLGSVQYLYAPRDLPIHTAIDRFVEVEAASWKGDQGSRTAIKNSPRRLRFLHELAAGGDGLACGVHLLYAAGQPVSGAFCIELVGVTYLLLIGYDERFAKMSPGHLLIHDLLEHAASSGVREIDFLSSADWYQQWHPERRRLYRMRGGPKSLKGFALAVARHAVAILPRTPVLGVER